LKNYSNEEKALLLESGFDTGLAKTIDLILSIRSQAGGKEPIAKAATTNRDIDRRFCDIWDRLGATKEEKIQATNDLLKPTNLPRMIYTSFRLEINILNPEGDAHIVWRHHATNVGDEDILGESKVAWFEDRQSGDIHLAGTSDREPELRIETLRNYENYKEFFCHFQTPVKSGESIKYSYEYRPQKMFTANHYWDWSVRNLILNTRITIKHNKGKRLKSCTLKKETPKGLITETDADITTKADDQQAEIIWTKYFPEFGAKYRIYWEFHE
jgi:hypothetical protein